MGLISETTENISITSIQIQNSVNRIIISVTIVGLGLSITLIAIILILAILRYYKMLWQKQSHRLNNQQDRNIQHLELKPVNDQGELHNDLMYDSINYHIHGQLQDNTMYDTINYPHATNKNMRCAATQTGSIVTGIYSRTRHNKKQNNITGIQLGNNNVSRSEYMHSSKNENMMYSQINKQQTNIKLSFNQSNSNKTGTESKESDHVEHKEHHSSVYVMLYRSIHLQ